MYGPIFITGERQLYTAMLPHHLQRKTARFIP
jgi:hypothetical protein